MGFQPKLMLVKVLRVLKFQLTVTFIRFVIRFITKSMKFIVVII